MTINYVHRPKSGLKKAVVKLKNQINYQCNVVDLHVLLEVAKVLNLRINPELFKKEYYQD